MSYKFFKNTGIQFFGLEKGLLYTDNSEFNKTYQNLYRHLMHNWLPLSLNGQRNILMIRILNFRGDIMVSIDTNVVPGDKNENYHGIHEHDDILRFIYNKDNVVIGDYNNLTDNKELQDVPISPITKKYLRNLLKRLKHEKVITDELGENFEMFELIYKHMIYNLISNLQDDFEIQVLGEGAGVDLNHKKVTLTLDLGNTRSIGLLMERDYNNKAQLTNVQPLWMIDFKQLTDLKGLEYLQSYKNDDFNDYLIPSKTVFRKQPFNDFFNDLDANKSIPTFNYPSIVAFGKEAQSLETKVPQTAIGLSGPKRYLWSTHQRNDQRWVFNDGKHLISDILKYINHNDPDSSDISDDYSRDATNISSRYSKSTMMLFAMIEIIYQAYCQINSLHYRSETGNDLTLSQLENVYLSFPTAMPIWERELLKKRVETALDILIRMDAIRIEHPSKNDLIVSREAFRTERDADPNKALNGQLHTEYLKLKESIYPKVELGFDEAACSQIAFLYGQSVTLKNKMHLFYNIFGNNKNVRIASLDIGGGTTDLSINDFKLADDDNERNLTILDKKHIYSDGFNSAGDDIIKIIIEKCIIPKIIDSQTTSAKKAEARNELLGYLGEDNIKPKTKDERIYLVNHIFLPIAYYYLYYLEHDDKNIIKEKLDQLKEPSDINDYLRDYLIILMML